MKDARSKRPEERRNTRHVAIVGSLSRRGLEALKLELHRLAKEMGVLTAEYRVERLVESARRRANRHSG